MEDYHDAKGDLGGENEPLLDNSEPGVESAIEPADENEVTRQNGPLILTLSLNFYLSEIAYWHKYICHSSSFRVDRRIFFLRLMRHINGYLVWSIP